LIFLSTIRFNCVDTNEINVGLNCATDLINSSDLTDRGIIIGTLKRSALVKIEKPPT